MDIQAKHMVLDVLNDCAVVPPSSLTCGSDVPHGVEKERPRPAGRVQGLLLQGVGESFDDDALSQPVRGVVLAQALTGIGVDDRLVENFQHIVLHVVPLEHPHPVDQSGHELLPIGTGSQHPIEEPGFHHPVDTRVIELRPGHEVRHIADGIRERNAHQSVADGHSLQHQQGVVDE